MHVNGVHKLGINLVTGMVTDAAAEQIVKKSGFKPKGGDLGKIAMAVLAFAGGAIINAFGGYILDNVGEEEEDEDA